MTAIWIDDPRPDFPEPPESWADSWPDRYRASDRFITDAVDYVSVASSLPDDVIAALTDLYESSDQFTTVVDDLRSGETSL